MLYCGRGDNVIGDTSAVSDALQVTFFAVNRLMEIRNRLLSVCARVRETKKDRKRAEYVMFGINSVSICLVLFLSSTHRHIVVFNPSFFFSSSSSSSSSSSFLFYFY